MNFIRSAFARRAAIVILAAFAAALPQIVIAQSDPLAGTWNFVPERSTFTPGPAGYKSMTLAFSNSGESQMTVEGVDAEGKPVKATYAAVADGKPHPVTGMAAFDSVSWNRSSDTVTSYMYLKRKVPVILGNRVLSPDGNTLTFRETTFDNKGKQISTAVMVFAKPGFELASATPGNTAGAGAGAAAAVGLAPRTTPDEDAGAAALERGDDDAAIRFFTAAIDKKDKLANPLYDYVSRGVAYVKKGMNEQALADFDTAVKLKPDDTDARFRRGGTRIQLKQYQGAIEDLTAVIQTDPMHAAAYRLRGFSYNMLDQNTNGTADNDKACSLNKELCLN